MKGKRYIKRKWLIHVFSMYKKFGKGVFTSRDATEVAPLTHGERAGMFHSLRCGGIIVASNGWKRGYHEKTGDVRSTPWKFTFEFVEYMETGGYEEIADDLGVVVG